MSHVHSDWGQGFPQGTRGHQEIGRWGATLLEVLIVAGVLLVGMYTVLRVFPVGFDVVQRAGYITLANRYAQTLLGDLASNPAALPDGILPAIYDQPGHGLYINDSKLRPDDIEAAAPTSGVPGLRDFRNSLVQFRRIYQETTRVPRASASTGNVSRYVLRFAPIEQYSGGPFPDLFVVYSLSPYTEVDEDDWNRNYDRRYRNNDGYYTIVDSSNNPVDEEDPGPHFLLFSGVNYDRTFKLDFSIRPRNLTDPTVPAVQRITDKILVVPASNNGDPVRARDVGGSDFSLDTPDGDYIWGSAVVRRRFREGRPPQGAGDAYWYEIPTVSGAVNPMGVIQINPGLAGLWIGLDYSVMDWQILHDDVDVPMEPDPDRANLPANEQRAWVKLSFPFIDLNPIGAPGDNRLGMQDAIIIQNIDPNSPNYGEVIDPGNSNGTWSFHDVVRNTDESKAGRIGLLVSQFNQPGNPVRRIRIYYRTLDNFAAQVIKPFATYTAAQWWASTPERVPGYNRFVLDRQGNGETWLIFALADVGKTVSVDYTYEDGSALRKVVGEMHTIQERRNWGNPPMDVGFISLNTPTDSSGNRYRVRSIDSVRGMSLEVRVSWAVRGAPLRTYDILSAGWNGQTPVFWDEDGRGRLQTVSATAIVAKPR